MTPPMEIPTALLWQGRPVRDLERHELLVAIHELYADYSRLLECHRARQRADVITLREELQRGMRP